MNRRALIVEDNQDIAHLVRIHLGDVDCRADIAASGSLGLAMFEKTPYDLVVLDIMLPGLDGLEVCRRIRQGARYVPILMLTAKSTEVDRILGLEIGADDYLTKPFSVRELVARVRALFRRVDALSNEGSANREDEKLEASGLSIDVGRRRVEVDGREVDLTAKEFELLLYFARNPGRVYSRDELLDQVWGYNHAGYQHTVNSHINRLRGKIESDPANPQLILTVWGVGYRFTEVPA
jgi:DNA-binding response OmpR family regulator